ncbi:EF-hand domain-containing protein [Catellatospora sp. KI3]|uniref:EF-hand domain-containing protein n=1 Tax=Catellatospora sp. KI3 TaxID=3041620 RepID=UPI0024828FA1|nr:EF-hand domain-containing protein [Catellatospora sp. KI3]MDI1463237.1 EF-hand domain-containing protein [Catellatospora sp. KI3]
MVSALQKRKLDLAFAHFDIDGNGQIECDEILALASRLLLCFRRTPACAKGRAVLERHERLWDEIARHADADTDGAITYREFHHGMTAAFLRPTGRATMLRPAVEALIDVCDTDGDGRLDLTEFATMHRAFGTSRGDVRVAFAALDADGDGRLSADELTDAAWDFYTSPDPRARGNWFFGDLTR